MKKLKENSYVASVLVFLLGVLISFIISLGQAQNKDFSQDIYEEQGKSYIDLQVYVEEEPLKEGEELSISEYNTYMDKHWNYSAIDKRTRSFTSKLAYIQEYHSTLREYESLPKEEQKFLKKYNCGSYKTLQNTKHWVGETVCKVPLALTIRLTTVERTIPYARVIIGKCVLGALGINFLLSFTYTFNRGKSKKRLVLQFTYIALFVVVLAMFTLLQRY